MIALLNWRIWATVILAAVLGFTHLSAYRHGRQSVQAKWDRDKVQQEKAAQEQTARNLDLQRQAEKRYVVQGETREKFFVTTVKEIQRVAAPLATCPLGPDLVRVLNDANHCARGDSSAPGCPASEMPSP